MFTAIIIRDSDGGGAEVLENYKRAAAARKGVSGPTDLRRLGLLTTLGGYAPRGAPSKSSVLEINEPLSNASGVNSNMMALRIEPAPASVRTELSADGQAEPIIYAPLSTSYSRKPGTRTLSFDINLDSRLTPRGMGLAPGEWMKLAARGNWIGDYIVFLESLAIPLPVLGRKPWLALKHGADIYGASRFGLQLESVSTQDSWQGPNGIQSAKVSLRLREYLVV